MKKKLTLVFLSFSLLSLAQGPIVEGTYLPVKGTSVKQVWDTSSVFTIPTGGSNQVWDYSGQFTNVVDTFQIQTFDPSITPYKQYFPGATHASFLRTPFNNQSDSLYSYFIIDRDGVHNLGGFNIKKAYDTSLVMNPTEFLLPSSCNYGMLRNDTSKSLAYANFSGYPFKIKETKYKIMKGYGYGSLKTPVNTFNNVLLAREDITIKDSLFIDLTHTGNYTFWSLQSNNFIAYAFIRNNTFGSSYLMHLTADATNTVVDFGWYSLPVNCGSISGTVYDSLTGAPTTQGEALLYRENSNFAKNDILDRSTLDVNGNYQFDSIPYGEYRVAIRPDAVLYPTALTTYYGDSTNWLSAPSILTSTVSTPGKDIHLQYHPPTPGLGNINGRLALDLAVRSSNPIPGVDIIVKKKPGGNAVREVKTDLSGSFSLNSSIPDGNYDLFVDIPGLHMAGTYNFTIVGGTLVNALDFTVGTDSIHPNNPVVTAIKEQRKNSNLINVYPNPYASHTTISINITEKCDVLLEVYNVLGEKIQTLDKEQKSYGTYFYDFNAKNINPSFGVYFIKLNAGNETAVIKVIEQ